MAEDKNEICGDCQEPLDLHCDECGECGCIGDHCYKCGETDCDGECEDDEEEEDDDEDAEQFPQLPAEK